MNNFFVKIIFSGLVFPFFLNAMQALSSGEALLYKQNNLTSSDKISLDLSKLAINSSTEGASTSSCLPKELSDGADEHSSTNKIISVEDKSVETPYVRTFFSPGIIPYLIEFINQEQQNISGAVYRFTHYTVAEALVEKGKQLAKSTDKIPVTFCVNQDFQRDDCRALALLIEKKVSVFRNGRKKRFESCKLEYEIMHNKFIIFGCNKMNKSLLWTGSFNVTGQANTNSWENVIITDDAEAISKFREQYQILLQHSRPVTATECKTYKPFSSEYAEKINGL